MPYRPILGGYNYRQQIETGYQQTAKIRRLVESAISDNSDLSTIYLKIAAITLLTVRIDETLAALAHYTPKETDQ